MTNKLIIKPKFTLHQKIHLIIFVGSIPIIIIVEMLRINLNLLGYFTLLFFILIYFVIFSFAFSKIGFLKLHENLYRGLFVYGKLLFKKKIDLKNRNKIATLKFKRYRKLAFISRAKPDLSEKFNSFEINLLNEKHTERDLIIILENEIDSRKLISFLESNFTLKHENFNPNFKN